MRKTVPSSAQMKTAPFMWAKISSSSQLRLCSEFIRLPSSSDIERIASERIPISSILQRAIGTSLLPAARSFADLVSSLIGRQMPRATIRLAIIDSARAAAESPRISSPSICFARAKSDIGIEILAQKGNEPSAFCLPAGVARYSIRVFSVCE